MTDSTRITLSVGRLQFSFATASELRNALLEAFADASYVNGPYILVPPETEPAWSWINTFIRSRTDWWGCTGVALQHAVHEGGDLARVALADLLANFKASIVLLPWTEPLGRRWPDVRATMNGAGWDKGQRDPRLEDLVTAQKAFVATAAAPDRRVTLWGFNRNGTTAYAEIRDISQLEALLVRTAQAGRFHDDQGPWSWLNNEVLHRRWLSAELPSTVERIASDERVGRAFLDWLGDGWDAWRFVPLLERWCANAPSWWAYAAKKKPAGWQRPIRPSAWWSDVSTLGDVALRLLTRARAQLATPPVLDLPPLP